MCELVKLVLSDRGHDSPCDSGGIDPRFSCALRLYFSSDSACSTSSLRRMTVSKVDSEPQIGALTIVTRSRMHTSRPSRNDLKISANRSARSTTIVLSKHCMSLTVNCSPVCDSDARRRAAGDLCEPESTRRVHRHSSVTHLSLSLFEILPR
jgi:hypothetical protein